MPLLDPFSLKPPDPPQEAFEYRSSVIPGGVLSIPMQAEGAESDFVDAALSEAMQRKYCRSEDNPNPVAFAVNGRVIDVQPMMVRLAATMHTMQVGPDKYTFDQCLAWIVQVPGLADAAFAFCYSLNQRWKELLGKPEAGTEPLPGTASPNSTTIPNSSSEETSSAVPATESEN